MLQKIAFFYQVSSNVFFLKTTSQSTVPWMKMKNIQKKKKTEKKTHLMSWVWLTSGAIIIFTQQTRSVQVLTFISLFISFFILFTFLKRFFRLFTVSLVMIKSMKLLPPTLTFFSKFLLPPTQQSSFILPRRNLSDNFRTLLFCLILFRYFISFCLCSFLSWRRLNVNVFLMLDYRLDKLFASSFFLFIYYFYVRLCTYVCANM